MYRGTNPIQQNLDLINEFSPTLLIVRPTHNAYSVGVQKSYSPLTVESLPYFPF